MESKYLSKFTYFHNYRESLKLMSTLKRSKPALETKLLELHRQDWQTPGTSCQTLPTLRKICQTKKICQTPPTARKSIIQCN